MEKKNKRLVEMDTPLEMVLEWDKAGDLLVWDPDKFQTLPASELAQLSKTNRDRYTVIRDVAAEVQKRSDVDETVARSFNVGEKAANASDRLRLRKTREGFVQRWERPAMVEDREAQGWQMARKGNTSFRGDGSDIHRIGAKGQEELVLIEISEKDHQRLKQNKRQRRERAFQGIEAEARRNLQRLGQQAGADGSVVVDDNTAAKFRPISQDGGE